MVKRTSGKHVTTVRVPGLDRIYKITETQTGLRFYRAWNDEPGIWHHEGDAPGVDALDYKEAIGRFICGQSMDGSRADEVADHG